MKFNPDSHREVPVLGKSVPNKRQLHAQSANPKTLVKNGEVLTTPPQALVVEINSSNMANNILLFILGEGFSRAK